MRPGEQARFHTCSGLLTVERKDDWIKLDFLVEPEEQATSPSDLNIALGITPRYVGKTQFDYLVEVDSEDTVGNVEPDLDLLAMLPVEEIIVTSTWGRKSFPN